jgi:hypothetical protein
VNSSLSLEFIVGGSLRQGDQMAPFLFLLVMEDLQVFIKDAIEAYFFKDIRLKEARIVISLCW